MNIHRKLIGLFCIFSLGLFCMSSAFAYDLNANFTQSMPELVSGFFLKAGPTKGGPYPNITDCGKPAIKADGTFDCIGKDYTANPVYVVVANYDSAKKEISTHAEVTMTIPVSPPANLKIRVLTVTTISTLSKYGNPIATTTIKWTEVSDISLVKEGTKSYRNKNGAFVTNTIIAMR